MCVEINPSNMEPKMFKVCPFVNDPLENCYCLDMTSRNIDKVLQYCSGDYEQCAIYIESRNQRPHI